MNQCKQWVHSHGDGFIDLVRIYLGIGLIVKAIYFMMHRDDLLRMMEGLDTLWIAPAVLVHYIVPAHLFGGLLLTVGLLTRVAALAQIPILVTAVFYVYLPKMLAVDQRQSLEFSALVLFLLLLISIYGAGRWSVDHLLARKDQAAGMAPNTAG